jgi:hypothetical protein
MENKTAMQELINRLDKLETQFTFMDNSDIRACKTIATELLSKEESQIKMAFGSGADDMYASIKEEGPKYGSPLEYFTQTYQQ